MIQFIDKVHYFDISHFHRLIKYKNDEALKIVKEIYKTEEIVSLDVEEDEYLCIIETPKDKAEYIVSKILENYTKTFGCEYSETYPEANL